MKKMIFAVILGVATLGIFSCSKDDLTHSVKEQDLDPNFKLREIVATVIPEEEISETETSLEYFEFTFSGVLKTQKKIGINKIVTLDGFSLYSVEEVKIDHKKKVLVNGFDLKDDEVYFINPGDEVTVQFIIRVYRGTETVTLWTKLSSLSYFKEGGEIGSLDFSEDENFASEVFLY